MGITIPIPRHTGGRLGQPYNENFSPAACMDCHSNETVWPWTSNIAPMSWLIQLDVERGRRRLNFSTWQTSVNNSRTANRIVQNINNGEMPLSNTS